MVNTPLHQRQKDDDDYEQEEARNVSSKVFFSEKQLETSSSGQRGQTWAEIAKDRNYDKHGSLFDKTSYLSS